MEIPQERRVVSEIPGPQSLLIVKIPLDWAGEFYFHTPLHRAANDALARVAVLRLARDFGRAAASLVADLGLLLCLGGRALSAEDWPVWRRRLRWYRAAAAWSSLRRGGNWADAPDHTSIVRQACRSIIACTSAAFRCFGPTITGTLQTAGSSALCNPAENPPPTIAISATR